MLYWKILNEIVSGLGQKEICINMSHLKGKLFKSVLSPIILLSHWLDGDGSLLAGTDNGLFVYDESVSALHLLHDSRNPQSLSNNIIWNIFTDKEKNVWIGTDYGISLAPYNKYSLFISISQLTGTGNGNHFYALYEDSRENFWFGGTNGFIRFNETNGNYRNTLWYRMGDSRYTLPHNRIRQVYEDKEHLLWIASDGGVNRYDYASKQFIRYNITDNTGINNSNWAYHIFEDNNGKLWIATCLGGIFIVDKQALLQTKSGNFIAEYNFSTQNGLSGMFINQIVPDQEGKSYLKLKTRLKELTGRSNGMGYDKRKAGLHLFMRGWIEYFQLADMQSYLKRIDERLCRRICMCIWKCWKKVKTKFVNLQKCGISKFYSWQHANTRLGYWCIAGSWILTKAITNDKLKQAGYPTLIGYYSKLHRR